jgi:hypothetical protein
MDDITSSIIRIIPSLLVWVIGLVLSIKILRRGGSKPEKLLVAGCSLILLKTILNPFPRIVAEVWANTEGMGAVGFARIISILSIPGAIISLAGFICLVMAFWIKFKVEKPEVT